jgi:hypothetical protein
MVHMAAVVTRSGLRTVPTSALHSSAKNTKRCIERRDIHSFKAQEEENTGDRFRRFPAGGKSRERSEK